MFFLHPLENTSKPLVFLFFLEGTKWEHWEQMGYKGISRVFFYKINDNNYSYLITTVAYLESS